MQENDLILTDDGSSSLYSQRFGESYHSKHGALKESLHVFIKMGLHHIWQQKDSVSILEIGLGTGLNACLTYAESLKHNKYVHYTAIEAYPIDFKTATGLNYFNDEQASDKIRAFFEEIHRQPENEVSAFGDLFQFQKLHRKIQDIQFEQSFDLIYFDAFAPNSQPEMWTETIFHNMHNVLNENGCLVTYCAKGEMKRTLKRIGFTVERLPGPPKGKREMTRATKASILT